MKNGQGIFDYSNGLKYDGSYKNDVKEGKGTIYGKNKLIAFQGEIKNGLPHGKGKAPGSDGQLYEVTWNEGISSMIEDTPIKKI